MEKMSEIGYIQKAHGLKGEVFFKAHDGELSYLSKNLDVYLGGVQFTISSFREVTGGAILKLAGVDDRNGSDLLKAKAVSIDSEVFAELSDEEGLYLNQLLGFAVFMDGQKKGEVSGFAVTEAHDLLIITTDLGEIELPYVDSFINEIKNLEKELHVDCPVEIFDPEFFSGGAKK